MAIPVIDFSKLESKERADVLAQIADCCENWGFFQLVNHGIPVDLLERVKKVTSECYKLREEGFKNSIPVQRLNKMLEEEGAGATVQRMNDVDWEDVFALQDDNPWPSNPPEFKETMMEFRRELKKLAEKILEIMEENLGIGQGHIKKAFTCDGECKPFFGTKVSHYPPCPHPDLVPGLRAHTDAGGVILLFQDEKVDGLQVLKDDRWFDVQPLANAIVINTGDQIEAVSNGKYKSAWHRILAKHDGIRRSIASFYNPCFRAVIGPAPTSENEGISYPKYVFGDYMNVYQKDKFGAKELRFMKVVKAE